MDVNGGVVIMFNNQTQPNATKRNKTQPNATKRERWALNVGQGCRVWDVGRGGKRGEIVNPDQTQLNATKRIGDWLCGQGGKCEASGRGGLAGVIF